MLTNGQINLAIGKDCRHRLAWLGLGRQGQWLAFFRSEPSITAAQHQPGIQQAQAQFGLFQTVFCGARELGHRGLPAGLALRQLVCLALHGLTRRRAQARPRLP